MLKGDDLAQVSPAAGCHGGGGRQVFAVGSEGCPGPALNREVPSLVWPQLCQQEWNLVTFEGNDLNFILFLKLGSWQVDSCL